MGGEPSVGVEPGVDPLVGVVLWLDTLDSSVDRSVLKLAFDRRRNSLKFRNDGDMALENSRLWPASANGFWKSQRARGRLYETRTSLELCDH